MNLKCGLYHAVLLPQVIESMIRIEADSEDGSSSELIAHEKQQLNLLKERRSRLIFKLTETFHSHRHRDLCKLCGVYADDPDYDNELSKDFVRRSFSPQLKCYPAKITKGIEQL